MAFRRHVPGPDLRQLFPGTAIPPAEDPPGDSVRFVSQVSPAQVHSFFRPGSNQTPVQAFHPTHIKYSSSALFFTLAVSGCRDHSGLPVFFLVIITELSA